MNPMLYDEPELYDALLPSAEDQLNFYRTLSLRHPDAVLALACGTGQILVPIAEQGVPITGLDRSANMLSAAKRRAAAAGVSVELIEGDGAIRERATPPA